MVGIEIVFDLLFAQPIGDSKFHGGGEYIKTVFQALAMHYHGKEVFTVCYDENRYIDDWIVKLMNEKKLQKKDVKTATDIVDYITYKSHTNDVRFFAGMIYPYSSFQFPDNVVTIGTCHGLRVLEKTYDKYAPYYATTRVDIEEMIKYSFFKKRYIYSAHCMYENALKVFDILITDSEHSAYSIKANYPEIMKKKQIRVFYPPEKHIEPCKFENSESSDKYILMISANRWLKNSYRGVMALDNLYHNGLLKGVKTKVCGNYPKNLRKKIKNIDCFEFFGYVETEELEKLYRECDVFFYPTLNEGFGLPPMEALKYGKTCVVSAVSSLPEVYGDSVYYCNPYDYNEMKSRILQAIDMKIDQDIINDKLIELRNIQRKHMQLLVETILGVEEKCIY